MKKWIVLSGLWIAVFVFHGIVCYGVELKITLPDELTPYVEKIVNQTNEANSKDAVYVPIDIRQYIEDRVISWATSYKVQQEKEKLEKLRDMLISLPQKVQYGLIEQLKTAVGESK